MKVKPVPQRPMRIQKVFEFTILQESTVSMTTAVQKGNHEEEVREQLPKLEEQWPGLEQNDDNNIPSFKIFLVKY